MEFYFYLTLGLATAFGIAFAVSVRGILYSTPDTDNELMAYAAAQSSKWRWPSDIHKYGISKTRMKDVAIILLALFQKITGDKESDYPYTILTGFAVSASAVLIYLIGSGYWGPAAGFFISLIYLFSFWPWQVALYGGHVNIAALFFLASILFIQNYIPMQSINLYLAAAGALFCCAMFSSASSSKFIIPFWAAVFYSQHSSLINNSDYSNLSAALPFNNLWLLDIVVIFFLGLGIAVAFLFYKKIIRSMYEGRGFLWFRRIIKNKNNLPLEHYFARAKIKLKQYSKILAAFTVISLALLNGIEFNLLLSAGLGFGMVLLILTLPDVKKNVFSYVRYFIEPSFKTHFKVFIEAFAKRGITVSGTTRGAGWPWVPKVFWRIAPFHIVIFSAAYISLLILRINRGQPYSLLIDSIILIISISPVWWAEFTKAPQISRSYSPTLTTSLLFIGYSFHVFSGHNYLWQIAIWILAPVLIWNLWKLLSDAYPARMGATNMFKTLKNLKIKEIYTYNTKYNRSLVETIPGLGESEYTPRRKIESPFTVHHINSIKDIEDGWIVIPATNGKSITMHTDPEAINNNFRFAQDPVLNKLLESGGIEKIATAKIKTFGTSRIWSLEDEALGYIDLIMKDISPLDIYRGYAWLINANKLKSS